MRMSIVPPIRSRRVVGAMPTHEELRTSGPHGVANLFWFGGFGFFKKCEMNGTGAIYTTRMQRLDDVSDIAQDFLEQNLYL